MRKRQYLTPTQKHKKLERAKLFLGELKAGTGEREIVSSDEKFFTIGATVNNQNDRVCGKSSADIGDSMRTVFRRQRPCSLMVWAAV